MGLGIPPQQPSAKGESINLLESASSPQLLSLVLEGGRETMAAQILFFFFNYYLNKQLFGFYKLNLSFLGVSSVGL